MFVDQYGGLIGPGDGEEIDWGDETKASGLRTLRIYWSMIVSNPVGICGAMHSEERRGALVRGICSGLE